jgi:hypothetical protein
MDRRPLVCYLKRRGNKEHPRKYGKFQAFLQTSGTGERNRHLRDWTLVIVFAKDNLAFSFAVLKMALQSKAALEWRIPPYLLRINVERGGEGQRTGQIGSTAICNESRR